MKFPRLKFSSQKLAKGPDVIRQACGHRWGALPPSKTNHTVACPLVQWQLLPQAHMRSGDIIEGLKEDHPLPQAFAVFEQLLRSSRRNVSPVELVDRPFLVRHEHVAGTLVECREIAQTSSRANGVLHHPPEAFNRVEVVPAMGW